MLNWLWADKNVSYLSAHTFLSAKKIMISIQSNHFSWVQSIVRLSYRLPQNSTLKLTTSNERRVIEFFVDIAGGSPMMKWLKFYQDYRFVFSLFTFCCILIFVLREKKENSISPSEKITFWTRTHIILFSYSLVPRS